MNNKIDTNETFSMLIGIIVALFPGLANVFIFNISKNASLLSSILGFALGLIPVFMIMHISKQMNDQSLREYINDNFKIFSKVLNITLLLIAIFILFLNSWLSIDFIISQFLTRTSYYLITILLFSIIAYTVNKNIEVTSRTIFILFIFIITIMLMLWIFLFPYVKIDNLKPYIDTEYRNILKSSVLFINYTTIPIIYILDIKKYVKDKDQFSKKILLSYIFASFIITVFIFLIISIYTIDLASIFTYPLYSLFKKVEVFGFIERIENFAAIQIIVAFFIQSTYLIFYLRENIKDIFKIKNKKKISILTYFLSLTIPLISIAIFKNYNISNIVKISPYILGSIFIVIIVIFISSLKKLKK